MTESDCLFCRIAAGQVPARLIHDDPEIVAFHDVAPQAPIHVLLLPRRHIVSLAALEEGDGGLAGRMLLLAARLARELGVAEDGYRVVTNVGRHGGQSVPHLHFHLLGGRSFSWPPG
jgi:histidine triad (HIT) family protein